MSVQSEEPTFALWMRVSRLEEVGSESLVAFAAEYRAFIMATQREMENDVTLRNLVRFALKFNKKLIFNF